MPFSCILLHVCACVKYMLRCLVHRFSYLNLNKFAKKKKRFLHQMSSDVDKRQKCILWPWYVFLCEWSRFLDGLFFCVWVLSSWNVFYASCFLDHIRLLTNKTAYDALDKFTGYSIVVIVLLSMLGWLSMSIKCLSLKGWSQMLMNDR